jgi:hypothetical protein
MIRLLARRAIDRALDELEPASAMPSAIGAGAVSVPAPPPAAPNGDL